MLIDVLSELNMQSRLIEVFGIWSTDVMRETQLLVLALCEVLDAVNLATSFCTVYFSKGGVKGGKVIVMGCW